ncbi:MAG: hypothetical protein SOI21_21160, partial [Rahnella inusitata]
YPVGNFMLHDRVLWTSIFRQSFTLVFVIFSNVKVTLVSHFEVVYEKNCMSFRISLRSSTGRFNKRIR